jgi:tRNA(adenine34) deaminase
LAAQHNRVEGRCDASAHAELLALRQAAAATRNWRLHRCTLYSTLEPCPMCFAAAHAFRVERLVYSAPDHRLGAVVTRVAPHPFHNLTSVVGGVCAQECGFVLRAFFRRQRRCRRPKSVAQNHHNQPATWQWLARLRRWWWWRWHRSNADD